ncbi:MAG: cupredoxin domain-containing protein [Solirubrobacteraceae bacterium]
MTAARATQRPAAPEGGAVAVRHGAGAAVGIGSLSGPARQSAPGRTRTQTAPRATTQETTILRSPAPAPTAAPFRAPAPAAVVRRSAGHRQPHGAYAAADAGVTIADFHFTPGTTMVHVGDAITWTNGGPSAHTATARDGSFDTGTLSKGQSGSHTFTQAGTFTYFCKIHPFMHGTIVVLASTSTGATPPAGSPAPTATAPATPRNAPAAPASGTATPTVPAMPTAPAKATATPTLPVTGMDLAISMAAGGVLVGLGLALRRAVS